MRGFNDRRNSPSLFESHEMPFNLAGESLDDSLTAEGEARVRALAESEARKAQCLLVLDTVPYDQPLNDAEQSALDYLMRVGE